MDHMKGNNIMSISGHHLDVCEWMRVLTVVDVVHSGQISNNNRIDD